MRQVKLNDIVFGGERFVLIAGPCVIESQSAAMRHAEKISRIACDLRIPYVFKSSFDKANRTSGKSFRGPGLRAGLKILRKIKNEYKIPVLSDVHEIAQVMPAAEVLDIIQVPAFLCRQTDLVTACARSGRIVNVKKGQFLSPWDMQQVVEKIEAAGNRRILMTERGTCFGYNNLVSDFRSLVIMRRLGYPVVFDATHSVQLPGGLGHASGGNAEFIPALARCAIATGADALFMEVHENPRLAKSDGPNNLPMSKLRALLEVLLEIRRVAPADTGKK